MLGYGITLVLHALESAVIRDNIGTDVETGMGTGSASDDVLAGGTGSEEFRSQFRRWLFIARKMLLAGRPTPSYVGAVQGVASRLIRKTTIPQVKAKMPILQQVLAEDWLQRASVVTLDEIRRELRDLYKFLDDDGKMRRVVTDVTDTVLARTEGTPIAIDEDYADYHAKVSRYVADHADTLVIHKLRNNIPMTSAEFDEPGHILTVELDRLNEPPFNRPSFMRLFDQDDQRRLITAIRRVRINAVVPAA